MSDTYTWKLGFETAEVEGTRSGIERRSRKERRDPGSQGIFSNRMMEKRKLETRRVLAKRRREILLTREEALVERSGPLLIGSLLLVLSIGALLLGIQFIPVPGVLLMCFFIPCSIFCFYSYFESARTT